MYSLLKSTLQASQKITELKDVKTYRQAHEILATKLGVPIEDVMKFAQELSPMDMMRYDTALAEESGF